MSGADLTSMIQSVVRPEDYITYILKEKGNEEIRKEIPETCLIVYSETFYRRVKGYQKVVDIGSRKPTEIYLIKRDEGKNFGIVCPQYGDGMASATLAELTALGFRNFLSLGTTGHPTNRANLEVKVGDILLVNDALIYEGASHHHLPLPDLLRYYAFARTLPAQRPHPKAREILQDILKQRELAFKEGTVATTGAFYMESPLFIEEALRRNVIALDMETTALFSRAEYHNRTKQADITIATILYFSDIVQLNETSGEWNVQFLSGDVTEAESKILPVVIDFIDRI